MIGGATSTVSGNLTIKDKTVNVTFPAKVTVAENEVTVQSKFTINRQDWGLIYGTEGDPKDWVILSGSGYHCQEIIINKSV